MALYKHRPPCPNCEGSNQRTYTSGWANEQTVPVCVVKCLDCGYIGNQALIWLPDSASLNALDEDRRITNRLRKRIVKGAKPPRKSPPSQRITSDTLQILVRVVPGRVTKALAERLPNLKRKRHTPILGDTFDPKKCHYCQERWSRTDNLCATCIKERSVA